jgi:hypothetical protein
MARGGDGSGTVAYPAYMQTKHEAWLDDVDTLIQANLTGGDDENSPYYEETAYDPDNDIGTAQAQIDTFASVVAGIDDSVDWLRFVEAALEKADEVLFDEDVLGDAKTAFANRTETEFISGVNNLSAWAGGVGAVDSSAFGIGLALLEMERLRKVDDFDANLQFELYKLRGQYMLQGTEQMTRILSMRMGGEQGAAQIQKSLIDTKVIAKKEEDDRNIEMDVQDALWDLKLFNYGSQVMAGITGGVAQPKEPSPAASAVGGAAAGFAMGGPAGALVGGIGGLLGGIL